MLENRKTKDAHLVKHSGITKVHSMDTIHSIELVLWHLYGFDLSSKVLIPSLLMLLRPEFGYSLAVFSLNFGGLKF